MALVYRLVVGECNGFVCDFFIDSLGVEVINHKPFVSGVSLPL